MEINVVAENVEAAIRHAAEVEWPPSAIEFRIVDLDGQEVYWKAKVDRS